MREEEINTITQQTSLLKSMVNKLELRLRDEEQKNCELKLKLLASDDLSGPPHHAAPQPQPSNNHDLLMMTLLQSLYLSWKKKD